MKQTLLSFLVGGMILTSVAFAQEKKISGRVTSADGKAIPGVTVVVQGTNQATQTDANGNYSLNVPAGKVVVFRSVGFDDKTIIVNNNSAVFNVSLDNHNNALEEVVVTGMGQSRQKRALSYATQEVKGDKLTEAANSNLATALQGKVSGVQVTPSSGMPGASANITIRGARSFTGNNSPLYVVDGLPISSTSDVSTGNSVSGADYSSRGLDIDPNDIESINILKGQAASALYGMRASNGVIIITTKSGKGKQGKPQISYNSNVSFDKVAVLPDFQTTYAQGINGEYSPLASTSWGPAIPELKNDAKYGGNTVNDYTNKYGKHEGMYYVPQRANAGMDPWVTPQVYNNAKDFFNIGNTFNNSFNIMQGFDKGSYAMSLGATNANGIVPSTGMDRYTAKLSGEAKLSDKWTTGFTGNYVNSHISKQTGANNGIIATLYGAPASYDLKGIPSYYLDNPTKQNTYRGTTGFDGVYWATEHNKFTEDTQRFFGNGFGQYATNLGENQKLTLKYQAGVDSYTSNYTDLWGYGHANGKGEVENYHFSVTEWNSLGTAAYNWKINDDLVFDAMIGNEIVNRVRRRDYGYGMNFNFPGWDNINNASTVTAEQTLRHTRTFGTFGSLALAYKNMLFLNATGRNDIVSSMPRNNRSFFYPSVSAGFVFTELEGVKNSVLTMGKLRASYAEVGQAGDYYENYFDKPTYGGGFSSGTPILYPINSDGVTSYTSYPIVYDPNLKPQNTQAFELGTDLTFWNGLINLNYTFSRQNVKDQIFEVPLAASTGYSSLVTNGGKIHTNSHELTLAVAPYRSGDFKWDFAFNFTKIDNYVDELKEGVNSIFMGGFVEPQVRAGIGYKFPVIYGVSYLRNDAGQIVVDADGLPQAGEEKVIGKVSPDFNLGFNTNFEYKKIRLSAVLDWKQGGQMFHGTSGVMDYYGVTQKSADFRSGQPFLFELPAVKEVSPGVYEKNDILIDPSNALDYFTAMNGISESSIRGTSFVKLREIAVGYPVYQNSKIKVDVNAFARNIILWSELKGFDPEVSQGNTNMSGAFERFSLPGTSSYGLGVNVKF
ncbi:MULTISPECIES: SusC/RagA family TonB-linked outer membrane protein [unclassified Sphingobacterium]|uniref:SusC/RagA family TonB-linked outer membrane protein n=1 Tax=unclassified Sphingobacterium TaxID=2609468 RepID=UPI0029534B81|nr:SusC/RagA family TonB-linked outer membrane protein [Sphingobacterium sp. UGAL515B_05]WON95237.1 SusC/RagA family TonB-linked outer membrane protein [Sphingobacterium sp. UGAL515B_05]